MKDRDEPVAVSGNYKKATVLAAEEDGTSHWVTEKVLFKAKAVSASRKTYPCFVKCCESRRPKGYEYTADRL